MHGSRDNRATDRQTQKPAFIITLEQRLLVVHAHAVPFGGDCEYYYLSRHPWLHCSAQHGVEHVYT